jgi:hypothetical protein
MISSPHVAPRAELLAYEAALPRVLQQHEGEYVVIKGEKLMQFFQRYDEALEWAYATFGLDAFFVKKVLPADMAMVHFTRDLGPCRS